MRIMIIPSVLIGVIACLASCSFLKSPEPETEAVAARQEKKAEESRASQPVSVETAPQPIKKETAPLIREPGASGSQPGTLPGDMRRGLRSPDLPNSLPMTIDGKINRADPTNA